jgi:hypothetical protein
MSDNLAGGRKAQTMPRDMSGATEQSLNRQIEAFTDHVTRCLANANAIDPSIDGFGHARSSQIGDAIALARISAKLAMTMGKMQGELSYNFNYNHNTGEAASGSGKQGAAAARDLRLVPLNDLPRTPEGSTEYSRRYAELYHSNWTMDDHRLAKGEAEATPPPSPESERFE